MKIYFLLAQNDIAIGLGKIAGILNAISMLLFFGALIVSGVGFATGRTEALKYGIVGAGIGGLAWVVVKAMFQLSGSGPTIEMQGF